MISGSSGSRVWNPVKAIFPGLAGNITPSQDCTPSLACQVISKGGEVAEEHSIGGQQKPYGSPHGSAEAVLSWAGDVASMSKA